MTMKGLEKAQKTIGNFQFTEFCLLREMRLFVTSQNNQSAINIELCMETETRKPAARIKFLFHRISSLGISELEQEGRIHGFDLVDLSDRKFENLRWQVVDYENKAINLYAEDAEIISSAVIRH